MGDIRDFQTHPAQRGEDMAYRKVRAGHRGSLRSRDLESEELQAATLELEWDMEKELQEPGLDRFQLECVERQPVGNSVGGGGGADLDLEPIQPSTSPHGRFQRLQEEPSYGSRFTRAASKAQRRAENWSWAVKYILAGAGVFILGLVIGRYTHSTEEQTSGVLSDVDVLDSVLRGITAEDLRALKRNLAMVNSSWSEQSELFRVSLLVQKWRDLGLRDIHLSNYTVLLSHPGPSPSTIIDKHTNQCFLPNGEGCDATSPLPAADPSPSFAAYSAVGSLEAEIVDVQYGSIKDLTQAKASLNLTNKIAIMKLGQAPLLYKLSLLEKMGFGGVLLYVDPCDVPSEVNIWHKAFGVTLNPGGDPSTPGYPSIKGSFRVQRPYLTSLLVQSISAGLAKEIMSAPTMGEGHPCTPLAMQSASDKRIITLNVTTQASYRTIHNVIGYLKGRINPDRYVLVGSRHGSWHEGSEDWSSGAAIMTQLISSMMSQAHLGWQPDRTIIFTSWGGSALGSIGSFEWGEENRVVLESSAVAYISLYSPVRVGRSSCSTASPSLFQLASDIHKRHLRSCTQNSCCPGPNISSLQIPGDVSFFANQLAIPTVQFTSSSTRTLETSFLSEAFFPSDPSTDKASDPSFRLHEAVAKMTAEAILRLSTDPVLPFYPLDIALDVQNKLKAAYATRFISHSDDPLQTAELLTAAAVLRDNSTFLQSESMRPANDPKERDPSHVRMLNDVLQGLEKSFLIPAPPAGLCRNLLYGLSTQSSRFSILKDAQEVERPVNQTLSLVFNAIRSAQKLVQSGLELFENDPDSSH
ncbi:inactive N-acetylated-alpha-linked acidic dipeptidase-like protein 2 isoform X1 [Alosa pseudoharengus]|uniref:inactive N-acetylated-alpha-linked acidic dipeptidase-like protein 2 isoform X1 n=1 Tax=Alosa pseudoharengus TaxID=34774 RepID=UPI003F8A3432